LPTESQHAQSRADAPGVAQRQAAMLAPANVGAAASIASESGATSTAPRAVSALALAEAPAITNAPPAQGTSDIAAAEPAPAQKTPTKKPRATWRAAPRYDVPRYERYGMPRYDQRYVQMEREPLGWQRPFGEREY